MLFMELILANTSVPTRVCKLVPASVSRLEVCCCCRDMTGAGGGMYLGAGVPHLNGGLWVGFAFAAALRGRWLVVPVETVSGCRLPPLCAPSPIPLLLRAAIDCRIPPARSRCCRCAYLD